MQNAIENIVSYRGSVLDEKNVFKLPVAKIIFNSEAETITDNSDLYNGAWLKSEIYKKSFDANGNRERISCYVKLKGSTRTAPVTLEQIEVYSSEPILNEDIIGIRITTSSGANSSKHFDEAISDNQEYEVKAENLPFSYVYDLSNNLIYGFYGENLEEGANIFPYKEGASIAPEVSVVSFTVRGTTFTFNTAQLVLE